MKQEKNLQPSHKTRNVLKTNMLRGVRDETEATAKVRRRKRQPGRRTRGSETRTLAVIRTPTQQNNAKLRISLCCVTVMHITEILC